MEERPTCGVYIEILTCHAIFYHLEDSRSHENEVEAERGLALGRAPALLWCPIRVRLADYASPI